MHAVLVVVASMALIISTATTAPAATISAASSPTSTTEQVEPYVLRNDDNSPIGSGGNIRCDQVGTFDYDSDRTDYEPDDPGESFTVLIRDTSLDTVGSATVTWFPADKRLDYTATIPIEAVIVKGGSDANVYDYRPAGTTADTGLGAPPNASGDSAELGNITFCSNPFEDPPPSNWCSPGYWRQPHHLDAWQDTGLSPTDRYLEFFEPASLSRKASSTNPSLQEVLREPQRFGGTAFNNVGDLLSDAHPGVNWSHGDDRTEDSCPLS
jgi:hypothetical protein